MNKFPIFAIADEYTCNDGCTLLTSEYDKTGDRCFRCFLFGRLNGDIHGVQAFRADSCRDMEYKASYLMEERFGCKMENENKLLEDIIQLSKDCLELEKYYEGKLQIEMVKPFHVRYQAKQEVYRKVRHVLDGIIK